MYCGRSQDFNSRESFKSILGRELSDRPLQRSTLVYCSGTIFRSFCDAVLILVFSCHNKVVP